MSYRQIQASWCPFPPDARATTRKEDDVMVRAVANHIRQTTALGNQMYEEKWGDADRRVSELEASEAVRRESAQIIADMRRERESFMSGELLELIATSPDEEIRQGYLKLLDSYRRRKRDDERRDELRHAA
ncbi:hypothetical protein EWM64_g6155 [Hericium alpestre]|uniref:Uncharacterized protein n=1 Tax=Hericium alpestre TaxID=135208 RepID=A0A4Y9ZWJ1_9AGAM|nr:hypothetical protein EWM64_g6155 [Hericium alpestre]